MSGNLTDQLNAAPSVEEGMQVIFKRTATLDGVNVGHFRFAPGGISHHAHSKHQVFVPLAGSVTITGPDDRGAQLTRRRTVGDISVTPAGQQYSAHWEDDLEYFAASLSAEFVTRATADFEANRGAQLVLACGPQDALVRSIAVAVATELDAGMPTGKLYVESLANALAVHVLRHYSTESLIPDLNFGGLPARRLRRVEEFIEANIDRDLSLTELAEEAGLSTYHFARAFKQTTGQTPIQFLTARRIEHARRLLAGSQQSIAEISLSVGFKNQSHFTTLFRKLTGATPGAWRNAYQR